MRKIRQVLEYRFSRKISTDQTALALSLSKGSVINYVERFGQSKLAWPLPIIHKGGDKVFVDYSGDGLEYIDRKTGEVIAVDLFVWAWGASSYTFAEASVSQKTRDFALSHVRGLNFSALRQRHLFRII